MQVGQKTIIPGTQTTIWGYNGIYPGPTIRATRGREVVVRQLNNLQESMSVHLHGGHTPPDSDGVPYDLIGPGAAKKYTYPNNQAATTMAYHDHAIDTTGRHVYMGLVGFYIIRDPAEDPLGFPTGDADVPLLVQDKLFNSDGSLNYPLTDTTIQRGVFGDTLLVNGAVQPFLQVSQRRMRFRIVNASNARIYRFALTGGEPLVQIGSDGGLLATPVSRSSITLAPGERADVLIDFAAYAPGTSIILKNLDTSAPTISDIMRFDVVSGGTRVEDRPLPAVLDKTMRPASETRPLRVRTFTLEPTTVNGRTVWSVNNQLYDPARIDATPRLNAPEAWTFVNNSGQPHPMHNHATQWRILDVNGAPPAAGDDGWKDTFLVPARGSVTVLGTFTDYTGGYVSHCHNIEHEDHAMMFNFEVQP